MENFTDSQIPSHSLYESSSPRNSPPSSFHSSSQSSSQSSPRFSPQPSPPISPSFSPQSSLQSSPQSSPLNSPRSHTSRDSSLPSPHASPDSSPRSPGGTFELSPHRNDPSLQGFSHVDPPSSSPRISASSDSPSSPRLFPQLSPPVPRVPSVRMPPRPLSRSLSFSTLRTSVSPFQSPVESPRQADDYPPPPVPASILEGTPASSSSAKPHIPDPRSPSLPSKKPAPSSGQLIVKIINKTTPVTDPSSAIHHFVLSVEGSATVAELFQKLIKKLQHSKKPNSTTTNNPKSPPSSPVSPRTLR
eukprot:TRINITY_DN1057_c0_g1_i4.p1 TRINITY_DN1057_c0_g1~~TRINITY_DN1057_c0_g1_i4.p1  ORF type:complete len:303 (-),score=78.52 TRINITY_DN1057_c0_g1_i4:5-913(-)